MELPHLNQALHEVPSVVMAIRSLIMMASHPQVAQAVAAHSSYAERPNIRLWDTLCLATALAVGTSADRRIATEYIRIRHRTIKGHGYNANSQSAQLFVWACLVENIGVAYKLLYRTQPPEEFLDSLYADWVKWAVLFGIREEIIPPDRVAFDEYMASALEDLQDAHPASQEVVQKILAMAKGDGLPWFALPLAPLLHTVTAFNFAAMDATLPSLARAYGVPQQSARSRAFMGCSKVLWSTLPGNVKHLVVDMLFGLMLPLNGKFSRRVSRDSAQSPQSRL